MPFTPKLSFRHGVWIALSVMAIWLVGAMLMHGYHERERIAKLKQWHSLPRAAWPKRLLELAAHLTKAKSAGLDGVLFQDYDLQYACKFTDARDGLSKFLTPDDFPPVTKIDVQIKRAIKNLPPAYQALIDPLGQYDCWISKS